MAFDETRYAAVKISTLLQCLCIAAVSKKKKKKRRERKREKTSPPATPPMFMFLLELKAYKALDKLEQVSRP